MSKTLFRCSILALALAATSCRDLSKTTPPPPQIEAKKYYLVVLSNGSAYFGQLDGLGNPYPVLTDVYYVSTKTDPQTKAMSNILVKRGQEWHAPDSMILNEKAIVLIEPVGKDSRVSQLIEESKKK